MDNTREKEKKSDYREYLEGMSEFEDHLRDTADVSECIAYCLYDANPLLQGDGDHASVVSLDGNFPCFGNVAFYCPIGYHKESACPIDGPLWDEIRGILIAPMESKTSLQRLMEPLSWRMSPLQGIFEILASKEVVRLPVRKHLSMDKIRTKEIIDANSPVTESLAAMKKLGDFLRDLDEKVDQLCGEMIVLATVQQLAREAADGDVKRVERDGTAGQRHPDAGDARDSLPAAVNTESSRDDSTAAARCVPIAQTVTDDNEQEDAAVHKENEGDFSGDVAHEAVKRTHANR
ncbi:hypothetical protein DAPPUDRAFT_229102 [Daphnia pulex]|uniref:Uncharacterized protein n=1 Tax=Daphnia pulex TaxID=6669 RepID=E9HK68_DAPPU|nr:hypothetical protein DAPPUDRAFT_229102 [Daphnia pulex]|eukprot:EFX67830.1 hypothetical protein DAPPUDRAFT_229102 [Daphnia pulex]